MDLPYLNRHSINTTHAFSLVELAVVLTIIALIFGTMVTLANRQMEFSKYDITVDRMKKIDEAIQRYVMLADELPCPASLTQAVNTANFGRESAAICDGTPAGTTDVGTSQVRIGTVPVRELNLPDEYMFDAWKQRITFVVVKALAADGAAAGTVVAPSSGGIIVNDNSGNLMIDTNTGQPMFVAYLLVSHGENRSGATNRAGTLTNSCLAGYGDNENCDNDQTFIDRRLANDNADTNAIYFDDLVLWKPFYLIDPKLK